MGDTRPQDTTPQTAAGKVLLHFAMSLDGFVAGPEPTLEDPLGKNGMEQIIQIELTTEGLGTLHIKVKDKHKRTWARITRLKHKESGAPGVHTPQTGGKYMK